MPRVTPLSGRIRTLRRAKVPSSTFVTAIAIHSCPRVYSRQGGDRSLVLVWCIKR